MWKEGGKTKIAERGTQRVMADNYLMDTSSSDGEFTDDNSVDLSYSELQFIPDSLTSDPLSWMSIQLNHNDFVKFPKELGTFRNLLSVDLSNNGLATIGNEILNLKNMKTFTARNNLLNASCLPKDFGTLIALETLNLSGNRFEEFPMQVTELSKLKNLSLGANKIEQLPNAVRNLIW